MIATTLIDKTSSQADSGTEVGLLTPNPHTRKKILFDEKRPFITEAGISLAPVQVAYETYGTLNRNGDNVILVCHALTGDAHVGNIPELASQPGWWDSIIGPGRVLDTDKYFVVCTNFLGSCYGTTGPVSINPATGERYGIDFPEFTVRDMVHVQHQLLQTLGVRQLAAVIGGSLGGMQVLEWALLYPDWVERIIPIATAAHHSAWSIGLNEAARMAIMNDPEWHSGRYQKQPTRGLALARMIAMISYRSQPSFQQRFQRQLVDLKTLNGKAKQLHDESPRFAVESYLRYQGAKLVNRFDANTYIAITRAMDIHDITRGRGSLKTALKSIQSRALCIGISSDILYPPAEQRQIAADIPGAIYREISTEHGHDAFLIEFEQLDTIIRPFLSQ